jgi:hypothetical protein
MDIATRKKLGIERQTTFGPSAPIDEWELEKATAGIIIQTGVSFLTFASPLDSA